MDSKILLLMGCAVLVVSAMTFAGSLQAPSGLFKDLNDEILGDAIILNGKQLFIDDYIIDQISGVQKTLNQPVKHPDNPVFDQTTYGYANILYEDQEKIFKMWYEVWDDDRGIAVMYYATSSDGISWKKPIVNQQAQNNQVNGPQAPGTCGIGLMKDPLESDPQRRYKILYSAKPDGTAQSLSTNAAYSPDGFQWTPDPHNPLIPFSDTQSCPYWDSQRGRYVAYLRFGPPNTRLVDRIESEDFVHWSPKVRVINRTKMDNPFGTVFYGMRIMPYEGIYLGLITAFHGETIKPIPPDKLWMDRKNVHLAFSRNGLTWSRVGRQGAIPHRQLSQDQHDWKTIAEQAVFIPFGQYRKDWDWGYIHPFQSSLIVDDQIRIYYAGQAGRAWWNFEGDPPQVIPDAQPPARAIGLAMLRLDGFVSVDAADAGTLTTKTLLFIGDTLEVNADARGGSIVVEALDPNDNVIEGFTNQDCTAITTDSVRHVLQWNENPDCHLIQARPIKLRFHLNKAKLYSFTPRIRQNHYVPSYD